MLLLRIFELIHQTTLVNFMFFLNIVKILKVSFWTFWRKICISLDLWALFFWKLCKAFRVAQCKQLRFLKSFKFWSIFHIQNLWYSFTRDNSFLQTLTSLSQKNPSTNTSRHINNITALVCIFSLILNCSLANQKNSIMNGWKCRSKGLLKLFFVTKKVIKKRTGSAWKFLQPPIPGCRVAYIHYFKINTPILCFPSFLKIISTLRSRSTKW